MKHTCQIVADFCSLIHDGFHHEVSDGSRATLAVWGDYERRLDRAERHAMEKSLQEQAKVEMRKHGVPEALVIAAARLLRVVVVDD